MNKEQEVTEETEKSDEFKEVNQVNQELNSLRFVAFCSKLAVGCSSSYRSREVGANC